MTDHSHTHPAQIRYIPPDELERCLDWVFGEIEKPLTPAQERYIDHVMWKALEERDQHFQRWLDQQP
jgi:hypothetical protein